MKSIGVEFMNVGKVYDFINANNLELKVGDKVVVDTARGREIATVVSVDKEITDEKFEYKPILRLATKDDLKLNEDCKRKAEKEFDFVQNLMKSCGINNKLTSLEFLIDGSKVVVTFVAEERVDFREFLKKMTERYRIKIEIKLIGSRDEIKIKGSVGPCGRVCCCANHLRNFSKISIKMAKNQNISLAPNKISGVCGKLFCCLDYENESYLELSQTMPKVNSTVKTPKGQGVVMYNDLFKQRCSVKVYKDDESFDVFEFEVKDIEFEKK